MNIVLQVLQIVAPVFFLAGIGLVWVRAGFEYPVAFVTRMAMTLAVPCLIFTALLRTEIAPGLLASLVWATLLAYGLLTLGACAVTALAGLDRRTYLAPLIFGNTGNLGLPLALFAFGQAGLGQAVVIFALMAVLSFTLGLWLVAGTGSIAPLFREPTAWSAVLGAVFVLNGWGLPGWAMNTLELIAQMAIPLMLITLGVAVGRLAVRDLGRSLALAVVKLALAVAAGIAAARALGLGEQTAAVLILQVATPVAVTSYLLAEKYRADAGAVAGLVVTSTLVAVLALPVLLGFLL